MSGPNVIAYATPDADGLPAFHPEAEAVIDAGAGPTRLKRFFQRRQDASRYFAKSMARRFDLDALADDCCVCGRPADGVAAVGWEARARPMPFAITSSNEQGERYVTSHAVCPACLAPWDRTTSQLGPVLGVLAYTNWGWAVAIALFGIGRLAGGGRGPGLIFPAWIVIWLACSTLRWLLTHWYVLRTPRAIRRLRRRHVTCLGLIAADTRENALAANAGPDEVPLARAAELDS